ncbi:MAG: VacJ family lipoprotein [Sulfurimonas sp.]
MKKIVFVLLFATMLMANDDFFDEFDSEFEAKKVEVFDPLSGYNRAMTTFNDYFYKDVLIPVTKGYAYVVPEVAREGVNNFFTNLFFPVRFINNILQLKFANATVELGRFFVNTTWGVLGFRDVATNEMGMKIYREDFGQTLGFYGVGGGIHVVIPLLGPSNLRDIVGLGVDALASPMSQMGHNTLPYKLPQDSYQEAGIDALYMINKNSFQPDMYEVFTKDAIDLYPFLRDTYTQKREKEISE